MLEIFEVEQLIMPLCNDSEGIFEEGNDDEEAADCWQVSEKRAVSSAAHKAKVRCFNERYRRFKSMRGRQQDTLETHGFTGSDSVSSQSSILLVCSRIASRGLGSLVASDLPDPPKEFEGPRLYPAVPRICAISEESL